VETSTKWDTFCGIDLVLESKVLNPAALIKDAIGGLHSTSSNPVSITVTRMPVLEAWRDRKIAWRELTLPRAYPCTSLNLVPVGADRLLAFPPTCWQHYSHYYEHNEEKIMTLKADDFWLISVSEATASFEPDQQRTSGELPFMGLLQLSLPLPTDSGAIHYFHFSDGTATVLTGPDDVGLGQEMEADAEGHLRKFRLVGADTEPSISKIHFAADGPPVQKRFKFGKLAKPSDFRGSYRQDVAKFHDSLEHPQTQMALLARECRHLKVCNALTEEGYTRRVDVTGELGRQGSKKGYGKGKGCEGPLLEVRNTGTGDPGEILSSFGVVGGDCQALGESLVLLGGVEDGEDAFYDSMRLVEWQTGKLLHEVELGFEAPGGKYIEHEWRRGVLPGASQTFVCAFSMQSPQEYQSLAFATPAVIADRLTHLVHQKEDGFQ